MCSRGKAPDFEFVLLGHELQNGWVDAAEIEERRSLRWRTYSCESFALILEALEHCNELMPKCMHIPCELLHALEAMQFRLRFPIDEVCDGRLDRMQAFAPDEKANDAAVNIGFLYVKEFHIKTRCKLRDRFYGEVGKMLMIDGVERALLHEMQ